MKRISIILCMTAVLLSQPLSTRAQSRQGGELFQQANALLRKGNCEDARSAVNLYNRAKKYDSNLRGECDKRINKCQSIIKKQCDVPLELTTDVVEIPYQGGESQVGIISSKNWNVDGAETWFKTRSDNRESLVISCLEPNNSTRERTTTLMVKSGTLYKSLKVIQEARGEFIEVGAKSLTFPSTGSTEQIDVKSNANWNVSSAPAWCKVEKADSTIRIIVKPNENVIERVSDIIVVSPNDSVIIKISQGAGRENLSLSQNNIVMPAYGGKHYMKVYTDADTWYVGDYPSWLRVERIGNDSISIECAKNVANGQERSGSAQVRTDRQTVGVYVTQEARMPQDIIMGPKTIGGRDFSLGISAGYLMPFVSTSAGGDYVGSVADYSLGTSAENADYKSATGYRLGLFADMRLHKNLFLIAGAEFTQIKYKNTFNQNTIYRMPHTSYQYLMGEVQNSYEERYTHTMIEVPVMLSYRFPLGKVNNEGEGGRESVCTNHLQLNFGPVINFGVTSKMELNGNTDSETLHLYNLQTNTQANNANYVRHTAVMADFNLYQPCVLWKERYTTGNVSDIDNHTAFTESPLHRINYGLRLGAAYEMGGLSFGLSYTFMLSNMANDDYWKQKRWTVLNESNNIMNGYKQHIHTLEFRIAYTLRYLGLKKNNK